MAQYREVNVDQISKPSSVAGDKLVSLYQDDPRTDEVTEIATEVRLGLPELLFFIALGALPLLFGGRDPYYGSLFKSLVFGLATVSFIVGAFARDFRPFRFLFPNTPRFKTLSIFLPFCLYLILQLIPLPEAISANLNSFAVSSYQTVGDSFSYLSVDLALSKNGAFWIFSFLILYSMLEGVPLARGMLGSNKKRSRHLNKVEESRFSPESRSYDVFAEVIQTFLIRLSLVCGILGVVHVVVQAKSFLGIFSFSEYYYPTSRAHFPFVNSNQLAILLEVGLILSFGRLLRDRQLKRLVLRSDQEESMLGMIVNLTSQLEKQAVSVLTVLIIALSLVMTMSRTGIVLSILGLTAVWFAYRLWPVALIPSNKSSMRPKLGRGGTIGRKGGSRVKSHALTLLMPVVFIFLVLFMLGDDSTGRVVGRFDRLYEEGGDVSRELLNGVTFRVFKEAPFLGVGLNSWRMVAPQFAPEDLTGWFLDYAHNDPFQLLSEVGLVGFSLLLLPLCFSIFWVVRFFRDSNLSSVKKVYLSVTLVSFALPFIHSFVDFPFHSPALSLIIFSACYSGIRALKFERLIQV